MDMNNIAPIGCLCMAFMLLAGIAAAENSSNTSVNMTVPVDAYGNPQVTIVQEADNTPFFWLAFVMILLIALRDNRGK